MKTESKTYIQYTKQSLQDKIRFYNLIARTMIILIVPLLCISLYYLGIISLMFCLPYFMILKYISDINEKLLIKKYVLFSNKSELKKIYNQILYK